MDQLSSIVKSLPPLHSPTSSRHKLDTDLRQYASQCSQLPERAAKAILSHPTQTLALADPRQNSIAYLAILHIILRSPNSPSPPEKEQLLDSILNFVLNFDPIQVRYVGSWLLALLERIAGGGLFSPTVAVELLVTAILKVDPRGSVLTSTHLMAVKLAYETNCIEPVLRLIDIAALDFPRPLGKDRKPLCEPSLSPSLYLSPTTGLTSKLKHDMVLEYELVCGLIYISRRDWTKAMDSLERALTHPVKDKGVSMIMIQAYKKWILVTLLKTGQVPSLPSTTSPAAKSMYSSLAEAYVTLAALFTGNEAARLLAEADAQMSVWSEDRNEGLVKEVLAAYQKWQIVNLRQVYRQVSVSKIREVTLSATNGQPLPDKEAVLILLRDMIESGMLRGDITSSQEQNGESYLQFHDDASLLTDSQFTSSIATSSARIDALGKQYKEVNDRLTASKEYAAHVLREQKRADKDGQDIGVFDSQIEDEDLMTGIMAHD